MAAAVRELRKAAPAKGLSRMIDQAGELNAQKNALDRAYSEIRGQIAMQMPLGDLDSIEKMGEEYEAKHFYPAEKRIDPEKLFKLNKELFWRLVKVNLQDAERTLSAEVFHKLLEVKTADMPKLVISKINKKMAA